MAGLSDTAIATRAYHIWEKQGRPHGRDREHWLQAVAELSNGAKPKAAKAKVAPVSKAAPAKAKPINGNGRGKKA